MSTLMQQQQQQHQHHGNAAAQPGLHIKQPQTIQRISTPESI
jgi:hypothetical protein